MSTPVPGKERIAGLDVLRGLAIFGILVVNVEQMFLPLLLAESPAAMIPGERGTWFAWAVTDALFRLKFLNIFSLLFGAGFALQWLRTGESAKGFRRLYLRRLFVLALFGLVHALFFYMADVLIIYALSALGLFLVKRWPPRRLLWVGSLLLVAMVAWHVPISSPDPDDADLPARQMAAAQEIARMREAGTIRLSAQLAASEYTLPMPSWLAIAILDGHDSEDKTRVEYAVNSHGPLAAAMFGRSMFLLKLLLLYTPFYLGWRTLALFMIAAGGVKLGLLNEDKAPLWRRVAQVGLGVGLPMTCGATLLRGMAWSEPGRLTLAGNLLQDLSSLLLAAGLASLIFLWCRKSQGGAPGIVQRGLSSVGRTALSNYLGQSVVTSLIATSYGLGLFGDLSRLQILGLAVVCFGFQLGVSYAWLQRFRMGPLEWVWRCLTYWQRVALRV
jgi:uncharacterized protein